MCLLLERLVKPGIFLAERDWFENIFFNWVSYSHSAKRLRTLNGSRRLSNYEIRSNIFCMLNAEEAKVKNTHFLSTCIIFMSIECIVVKTFVAPCTTHSLVSGMAMGAQAAKNTGSFRLHSGKNDKKCPLMRTTWKQKDGCYDLSNRRHDELRKFETGRRRSHDFFEMNRTSDRVYERHCWESFVIVGLA